MNGELPTVTGERKCLRRGGGNMMDLGDEEDGTMDES